MDPNLRVAVIGAGRMGQHHARVYSQLEGCSLTAVVDKDVDRAGDVAARYGARAYASAGEVQGELDAASIAVPTVYHAEVAVPLMERGVAVLVEKPLAPDAVTARQMLDVSRRTQVLLQVGHSERFNPVVRAMLRMEVAPRFIETNRISPFTFRSADIGVVFDMMIHDIDIVLHLVKQRDYSVDAVGVSVLGSCEDVANARVRFGRALSEGRTGGRNAHPSGETTVVNMTASRLALKTERRIRVFAPTAYLSMDYQKKTGVAIKLADNIDLIRMARERNFEDLAQMQAVDFGSMVRIEPLQVDDAEPLRAEIESFIGSVRTGRSGDVASAEDGCAAVEMAEKITRAINEQAWAPDLT